MQLPLPASYGTVESRQSICSTEIRDIAITESGNTGDIRQILPDDGWEQYNMIELGRFRLCICPKLRRRLLIESSEEHA